MKVVRNVTVTPVPAAPEAVVGIINLKGMVITLLSLSALLGHSRDRGAHGRRTANAIIFKPLSDGDDQMGLVIDAPGDLITLEAERIRPLPVNSSRQEKQIIYRLAETDEKLYRIIDLAAIVNTFTQTDDTSADPIYFYGGSNHENHE
jgi:purine-binding chemotaxis protein CheW